MSHIIGFQIQSCDSHYLGQFVPTAGEFYHVHSLHWWKDLYLYTLAFSTYNYHVLPYFFHVLPACSSLSHETESFKTLHLIMCSWYLCPLAIAIDKVWRYHINQWCHFHSNLLPNSILVGQICKKFSSGGMPPVVRWLSKSIVTVWTKAPFVVHKFFVVIILINIRRETNYVWAETKWSSCKWH